MDSEALVLGSRQLDQHCAHVANYQCTRASMSCGDMAVHPAVPLAGPLHWWRKMQEPSSRTGWSVLYFTTTPQRYCGIELIFSELFQSTRSTFARSTILP